MSRETLHSWAYVSARVLSVLVLLLCAYVINRQSEFSSRCLNSGLVDSLVFFSEDKTLPNCLQSAWEIRNLPDEDLSVRVRHWTASLDAIRSFWPSPRIWLQMIVLNEDPFVLATGRRHVLIGGVMARDKLQWQSAILQGWLSQTSPGMDTLERDVLADFLLALADSHFAVPSLTGAASLREEQVAIGYVPTVPEEYCLSDYRHPRDVGECTGANGRLWRSLLARGLWRIYQAADLGERRALRRWLVHEVASGSDQLIDQGKTKFDAEWAKAQIWRWSHKVLSEKKRARFLPQIEEQLGFRRTENPIVAIEAESLPEGQFPSVPILVYKNKRWNWWRAGSLLSASPPTMRPRHVVNLNCGKIHRLRTSAETSVLYLDECAGELGGWNALAEGNVRSFISENPKINLLWLNATALRRFDQEGVPTSRLSLRQMRRLSLWQEDRWDPELQVFRPRAAIDLVLGHRASRNML